MRKTLALICLFSGISVPAAWPAQTPASMAEAPAKAALDAPAADFTSIELVVHDRKGRPVTDLKPEELAVTDDGAPVKIASLRLVNGTQASNRLVALVFGQLDTAAFKNARSIADKLLKSFPDGPFAFAVFGVDGRLHLFEQYTGDRNAVEHGIERATAFQPSDRENASVVEEKALLNLPQASPNTLATIGDAKDQSRARLVYAALQQSQQFVGDRHMEPNIAGLTAIAQTERQLPGRKAIIYFAQSSQTDVNTIDQMRAAARSANEAGASIFSIDMNALDPEASQGMAAAAAMGAAMSSSHLNPTPVLTGPPTGFHSLMSPSEMTQMGDTVANFEAEGMRGAKSPLAALSLQTGGVCVGSHDNLRKPLQQLVGDLTSYYEVSYAPTVEIYDGKFHPVAVKSQRAGVSIRTTGGYLALPRGEELPLEAVDASLVKVLKSPAVPSEIAFRSAVLQFGKAEKGVEGEVAVEIPVATLELREDRNVDLYSLHVAVAAMVEDSSGKVVQQFSEDIRRHGGIDSIGSARAGFLNFERRLTLAPGNYVLKTVVLDSNSDKAGTRTQTFAVAPAPDRPELGDLVLIRRNASVTGDAKDLTRSTDGGVVPNLCGDVPGDTKDISLFFMVHETGNTAPAQVSLALSKDGKQLGQWPLHWQNTGHTALVPYLSSLNTAKLPTGRYDVTVSLKQGAETSERRLSFTKDDGPADAPAAEADVSPIVDLEPSGPLLAASDVAKPAEPPPQQQIDALIASARKRALAYSAKLPNFMCVEVIDRSVDHSGKGRWAHQDTIAELLRYRDNAESRVVLERNGRRSSIDPSEIKGAQSNGEFGGLLKSIFDPAAQAVFAWQAEKQIASGVVQVFHYQVAQKNSAFGLTDGSNWTLDVAFHGLLYIEPETGAVRYATVEAEEMPAKFTIRASNIQIVYDYIAINGHDYLLPVRGTVSMQKGKREAVLNTLQFHDYKRFASQSRILPVADTASAR